MPNHRSPLDRLRRFELGAAAVRALAVVAVLVALLAGIFAWRARPTVAPVAPVPGPATATSAAATIVVAVMGRVQRPGLVELPAGSRVADALAGAGGPLPETDLSTLNLARRLVDGELITVGVPAPSGGAGGPLNLNTATTAELETLPGVGPVLAQRIVEYRDQHGGFRTVDELRDVPGIGDATFRELESRVAV